MLPIKMLPDPFKARDDAHWYRDAIINEIGKQYLEPLGLDIWEMFETEIRRIRDDGGEQWMLGHKYVERQEANEPQPYIFVTDETTEEDVKKAFRAIKASRRQRSSGGRPRRDQSVAVPECAVLYDRHRAIDPTDKRSAQLDLRKPRTRIRTRIRRRRRRLQEPRSKNHGRKRYSVNTPLGLFPLELIALQVYGVAMSTGVHISQAARELGVSPQHLRTLERQGRIPPPRRDLNGRVYTPFDIALLKTMANRYSPPSTEEVGRSVGSGT